MEPPFSTPLANLGFTLYSTYTGHLLAKTKGQDFWSTSFVLRRNEWHRLTLVLSPSGLLMVLVDGESVIQIPDAISELASATITQVSRASTKLAIPTWPFGALFLGNYGLKPSQVESGSKDWLNELAHGAISGVVVQPHALSEMSALFSLMAPPSPPPASSTDSPLTCAVPSNFVRIERRSDLGSLETAIFGSKQNSALVAGLTSIPPNSFSMPSRICRPLFSVDEMDDWEKYLNAFSSLELKAFKPAALQPRRALEPNTPISLLCHDFRGGYFKDSAWERSPPLSFLQASSMESSTNSSSPARESSNSSSSTLKTSMESRNGFETFTSETVFPASPSGSDSASVVMSDYVPQAYTFEHWSYIDIFCYFSHARVTIPPVATIHAAHLNGVQVLGTFITEWEDGYKDTMKLIAGKNGDKSYYAKKLVTIAKNLNFEGWLVNIEHSMKEEEVPLLVTWMKDFKKLANQEGLVVVWYDSVIKNGELKWQSALNQENMIWFDACDLFFTDYHWKLGNLETTMTHAKEKAGKVLFGVDVWGRGTYGGGGWNVPEAIRAILDEKYVPKNEPTTNSASEGSEENVSHHGVTHANPIPRSSVIVTKPATPSKSSERRRSTEIDVRATSKTDSNSPKLGVAIFGPGWTIESQADSFDSLYRNEMRFWQGVDRWNLFSTPFEKHLKTFYRLYFEVSDPGVNFTVDDILSILDWSEDGAYGKAEEQARAQSQTQLNEVAGRFKGLPQLFQPRTGGSKWSWRHIRYDLVPSNQSRSHPPTSTPGAQIHKDDVNTPVITAEYLDSQPELTLSLWVRGNGPNSSDPWRLRVLLLDANNRLIQEFDTGVLTGTADWRQMTFRWSQYGSGVRSILWLDGTRDAEGWAGFYGCTIDRPSILLANPHTIDSVATYIKPRQLSNSSLPFVASFESGQGSALYSNGEPLAFNMQPGGHWYNLAAQTAMPSLNVSFQSISPSGNASRASPPPLLDCQSGTLADLPRLLSNPVITDTAVKHVSARLVDASTLDGGVWHGSSCLRIDAAVKAPAATPSTHSSPSDDSIAGSSTSAPKRRLSSRKLLLSSTRLAYPRTEATIELFPLSIEKPGSKLSLSIVFRPIHIPTNSTILARISRKKKSTGASIAPLQWELMDKEFRDPNGSSSIGWIHFLATWTSDPDILLDGISLDISAVQGSSDLFNSSVPNSPASSRISLNNDKRVSSSPLIAVPASTALNSFSVLVGLLKIDSAPSQSNEEISSSLPSDDVANTPLNIKYKLTWSVASLYSPVPVYDLTAYWDAPAVPAALSHLGAPHFIITVTATTLGESSLSPRVTEVLCQGRTWNSSWVVSGLPATGEVVVSVSTVYPDYTTRSELSERVQIAWPAP